MDNITFGTNWIAQAEQDGFYQTMSTTGCAYATGIYKERLRFRCHSQNGCPPGSQWYLIVDGGGVDFFISYGINLIKKVI
ncbi:hypothetical protein [Nostoc sp.]|uniref:hypothetical protein n=1 Tax=Nostoc sp. TaxID=1180 RepID=UPI002FF62918